MVSQERGGRDQNETTQARQETPILTAIEKPATEQQEAARSQEEAKRKQRIANISKRRRRIRRSGYIKRFIEGLAGLATVGILFYTIVYSHYAEIQATSSEKAANAAAVAAAAAKGANDIAEQTREISERAYVNIEHFTVRDFKIGGKPIVSYQLRNTGHRPASGMEFMSPIGFGAPFPIYDSKNQSGGDFIGPAPGDSGQTLGPNEVSPISYPLTNLNFPLPKGMKNRPHLPVFDMNKIVEGKESFEITVAVGYRDGFNHPRTTWKTWRYDAYRHSLVVTGSRES